ncbi:ABC transporter permease subunit [Haladaptatus salinisoli]|uniref:ABC transporter permease subunit n=1 Tax=Haladaptatus salinisoli TaxID=2884876 RepID=UPI001D0AFCE4|nr:ABC transporter permease subunit [Haladaptatus salinisoli]
MNWRVLAKKDVLDAYRKWTLGTLVVFFVLFFGVPTYLRVSNVPESANVSFFGSVAIAVFLVPLVGLMISHDAVAGERELGSLKLLLGLPYTRRDVVMGAAVGRAILVWVATLAGVLAAAIVFLAFGGSVSPVDLVVFLALALLLGAAYTGTGVGISAAVRTKNRALVGSVAFFLLTLAGWAAIPNLLRYVLNGFSTPRGPRPEWAALLDGLGPVNAYQTATNALLETGGTWTPPGDALYDTGWFALFVLVCWAVVPAALGYRRFRTVDL